MPYIIFLLTFQISFIYVFYMDYLDAIHGRVSVTTTTQKAWSGLSPTRNPDHSILRLWGLNFPSVESQLEPLFLF